MLFSTTLRYSLLLCFLVSTVVSDISDCLTKFDPNTDYFQDKVQASDVLGVGFNVTYKNSYKIVNNIRGNQNYVLYCTATQPNSTDIPNGAKFFQVPVKSVASIDRVPIAFLEIIGAHSFLKYVKDTTSITTPCVQNNSTIRNLTNDNLADVSLVFSKSDLFNSDKYVNLPLTNDLSPLKKLEWVKFVSLFFNLEFKANEVSNKIRSEYHCNAKNLANVRINTRKTIAWVAYNFTAKTFNLKTDIYYEDLIMNAGAYSSGSGSGSVSTFTSTDELHNVINNAYIVIDETPFDAYNDTFDVWQRIFGYYNPQSTAGLPDFITYRRVYRTRKLMNVNGYDDWSEHSEARPDIVLQDLIAIQYPEYQPSYFPKWLDVFSGGHSDVLTGLNCTNPNNSQQYYGNCYIREFIGDGKPNHEGTTVPNNNNEGNDTGGSNGKLSPVAQAFIVVGSIIAGLAGFILGAWLVLFARRKHHERFVKLKDEPEVQMSGVDETTITV